MMKRLPSLLRLILPALLLSVLPLGAKTGTYIWDMNELIALAGNPNSSEYKKIVRKADEIVGQKPVAVTDKTKCLSGDIHNYESLATYYWPDPDNPGGPYIPKDGYTNPETKQYDFQRLLQLNENCTYLSKAFFLTGDTKYHDWLCHQLDTWFLSRETRMNADMEYSQFIPGRNKNKGMPGGVLDAYRLVDVMESVLLADQMKSIGRSRRKALRRWFNALGGWMVSSPNGQKASQMANNHAIAYNGTLLEIALFTGNKTLRDGAIQRFVQNVESQIDEDGKMPRELSRTKAFTYSIFNLSHIAEVCSMIRNSGQDLPVSTVNRIRKSARYLSSFVGKKETFPYKEIEKWETQEKVLGKVLQRMTWMEAEKAD